LKTAPIAARHGGPLRRSAGSRIRWRWWS